VHAAPKADLLGGISFSNFPTLKTERKCFENRGRPWRGNGIAKAVSQEEEKLAYAIRVDRHFIGEYAWNTSPISFSGDMSAAT
jgi:hypothetical protein